MVSAQRLSFAEKVSQALGVQTKKPESILDVRKSDPRINAEQRLDPPAPLPFISRRRLKSVREFIVPPKTCHCCHSDQVELVWNSEIYNGKTYGEWPYAYLCHNCNAYVGLHKGTDLPLGTMADQRLRNARKKKVVFNTLIERKFKNDRTRAYLWLAEEMNIVKEECHFGMFNLERCEKAIDIIERELTKIK